MHTGSARSLLAHKAQGNGYVRHIQVQISGHCHFVGIKPRHIQPKSTCTGHAGSVQGQAGKRQRILFQFGTSLELHLCRSGHPGHDQVTDRNIQICTGRHLSGCYTLALDPDPGRNFPLWGVFSQFKGIQCQAVRIKQKGIGQAVEAGHGVGKPLWKDFRQIHISAERYGPGRQIYPAPFKGHMPVLKPGVNIYA